MTQTALQALHSLIGSFLFALTWHLVLKKTWPMQEKLDEIGRKLDKYF